VRLDLTKHNRNTGDVSKDIGESDEEDEWVGGEAGYFWEYSGINV
jgi:hypothetical protein